jgi:hypothetical protein
MWENQQPPAPEHSGRGAVWLPAYGNAENILRKLAAPVAVPAQNLPAHKLCLFSRMSKPMAGGPEEPAS